MAASARPLPAVVQMIETLGMGGAERLAVEIANHYAAAGGRSFLYVLKEAGPMASQVAPEVTLRRLDAAHASLTNPFAFAASVRRSHCGIADAVRDDGVGVVQSHLPGANFRNLLLQMRGRATAVPTIHNNREFDYGDADNPLRARLRRAAYRRMMRSCPAVVAVSQLVKDSMTEQLGLTAAEADRMVVVPNGVPVPEPATPEHRAAVRARFDVPGVAPLLLAAGRHTEQKDFKTLIEAAALLRDRGVAFRLVIAGDGELKPAHDAQVAAAALADHVALPGNLDDLCAVLSAADVFVMSSRWEGLPLVLLEAMAAGCAVAGTRIAGLVEVVREGESGVLAEAGDPVALADAMEALCVDTDRRAGLSAGARTVVERDYSFERVGRELADVFVRVARTS